MMGGKWYNLDIFCCSENSSLFSGGGKVHFSFYSIQDCKFLKMVYSIHDVGTVLGSVEKSFFVSRDQEDDITLCTYTCIESCGQVVLIK